MSHRFLFTLAFLAICAIAAGLRIPNLNIRPMHGDEAVHAVRWEELRSSGRYVYNPHEFHGPTLYYATFPAAILRGWPPFAATDAAMYRAVTVAFGIGSILLLWLLAPGLGRAATLTAALLTAVSPALVFYSRYYIQETLLVFFSLLVISAGWRCASAAAQGRGAARDRWAILIGVALGCMHATKETCILVWGCMLAALTSTILMLPPPRRSAAVHHATRAAARALPVALAVSFILFVGPGGHWRGVLDAIRAYGVYGARAGGGIHSHPWYYYLHMLLYTHAAPGPVWSEAFIVVLGLLGGLRKLSGLKRGARRRDAEAARTPTAQGIKRQPALPPEGGRVCRVPSGDRRALGTPAEGSVQQTSSVPSLSAGLTRFVTVYTLLLLLVYSAIPYKTPWCVLGPLHGLTLLAGMAAARFWTAARSVPRTAGPSQILGDKAGGGPEPPTFSATPSLSAERQRGLALALKCAALLLTLLAASAHLAWQAWRGSHDEVFCADPRNPYVYAHPVRDVERLANDLEKLAQAHPAGHDLLIRVIAENPWPLPWYLRAFARVGYYEAVPPAPDADVILVSTTQQQTLQRALHGTYDSPTYRGLRRDEVLAIYCRAASQNGDVRSEPQPWHDPWPQSESRP